MAFWTYILKCADGSYYTGHSDDIERRLHQHRSGEIRGYTFERRPVELMWSEEFDTREEAVTAEIKIKNWSRKKKEALIAGDLDRVSFYAIPPKERAARTAAAPRDTRHSPSTSLGMTGEGGTQTNPPVIVLVHPQLGENIGKAARAMLNFGLTEMRLVAPRDGWPNPAAGPAASGADIVLDQARVFDTLEEAVADCRHIYATTVRKRGVTKPVVTPAEAAGEIAVAAGHSAILFGPERSGLETDHVALARKILTVPINPEFGSLNLAQAVILCAYEWSKVVSEGLQSPPSVDLDPPAPQEELGGMIEQLFDLLETKNYFFPEARVTATKRTLTNLLTKPAWNSLEVRTLRGVISALGKAPRKRD